MSQQSQRCVVVAIVCLTGADGYDVDRTLAVDWKQQQKALLAVVAKAQY